MTDVHKILVFRYCLFGLNVALTEKFESNSLPMKIHVSEPCKNLLTPQYKTVERTDNPDLAAKVSFNDNIVNVFMFNVSWLM